MTALRPGSETTNVTRPGRWLLFSVCLAFCSAAPVWGLLVLTRRYPGVISMQPRRGALELSEIAIAMPAWQFVSCLFLVVLLSALLVGGSRRWLDPDRIASQTIRWSFGSTSLNASLAVLACASVLAALAPYELARPAGAVLAAAGMMILLLVPFVGWNAATLSRPRLSIWWRPRWPGVRVVGVATLLMVVEALVGARPIAHGVGYAVGAASMVVLFVLELFVAVAWIQADISCATTRCRQLLGWSALRPQAWQWLFCGVIVLAIAIPLLAIHAITIFVLPQYQAWDEAQGRDLWWPLSAIARLGESWARHGWSIGAAVFGVYAVFAQGRLLRQLGTGPSDSEA